MGPDVDGGRRWCYVLMNRVALTAGVSNAATAMSTSGVALDYVFLY